MTWTKKAAIARLEANERLRALLEIEPRLQSVINKARTQKSWSGYYRARTYSLLKREASRYVGWSATHPLLSTEAAYDVVITAIVDLLPPNEQDETPTLRYGMTEQEIRRDVWGLDDE